jgi:phosphoglycerate dehydrogenase-like enzyme
MRNGTLKTGATTMSQAPTKVLISWPVQIDYSMLQAAMPDAEFAFCPLADPGIFDAVADIDIWIAGGPPVQPAMLAAAKKLKWLQMFGAGLPPGIFTDENRDRGFILSNAKGVNTTNLAEHVMMFLLAFARGLPTMMQRQARREWIPQVQSPPLFELDGQTIGIVGYGAIGSAVAKRARALGMTVWGLRRSPSESDRAEVDRMLGLDGLPELLASVDHVVLTMPLTTETEGMIGKAEIAMMKRGAYLHNIGRGKLVDQDALIEALLEGRIAGAGLDVVTPEPLPSESPLWSIPNVLITGHIAGNTPRFFGRVMEFIAENMRRYARGEQPLAAVDLSRGY